MSIVKGSIQRLGLQSRVPSCDVFRSGATSELVQRFKNSLTALNVALKSSGAPL